MNGTNNSLVAGPAACPEKVDEIEVFWDFLDSP